MAAYEVAKSYCVCVVVLARDGKNAADKVKRYINPAYGYVHSPGLSVDLKDKEENE